MFGPTRGAGRTPAYRAKDRISVGVLATYLTSPLLDELLTQARCAAVRQFFKMLRVQLTADRPGVGVEQIKPSSGRSPNHLLPENQELLRLCKRAPIR